MYHWLKYNVLYCNNHAYMYTVHVYACTSDIDVNLYMCMYMYIVASY